MRHLAPPKASFDLAEKHGLFDLVMGSDGTPPSAEQVAQIAGAYTEVARREKGSFDDPDAPGRRWSTSSTPDGETGGRYVLHAVDQLELPYLPDPLATGRHLLGAAGGAAGRGVRAAVRRGGRHLVAGPAAAARARRR